MCYLAGGFFAELGFLAALVFLAEEPLFFVAVLFFFAAALDFLLVFLAVELDFLAVALVFLAVALLFLAVEAVFLAVLDRLAAPEAVRAVDDTRSVWPAISRVPRSPLSDCRRATVTRYRFAIAPSVSPRCTTW